MSSAVFSTGKSVRTACRAGELTEHTSGLAAGYVQANLVIVQKKYADDFEQFCHLNPKACPLLDMLDEGSPAPKMLADEADVRTDLPRYRVWKEGQIVDEPTDIRSYWQDDLVSFLLGCSFTFETALLREGVPVRHVELEKNVSMFRTNIECEPVGPFAGNLVVSMRPLTRGDTARASEISSRFPEMHGGPVHVGEAERIGITDLSKPDYGDAVPIEENEVPVFWACGVTPQAVIEEARLPFVITHSPGCMFVSDREDDEYEMV